MLIKILGAGVSGLCAAIRLAQSGENVTVYEKNKEIGRQMHENTQAMRNYEERIDLKEELSNYGLKISHFKPIHKITKYAPSGRNNTVASEGDRPVFQVIKRGPHSKSMDNQLYEQAVNEGVKFEFNTDKKIKDCEIISVGPLFKNGIVHGIEISNVNLDHDKILFFMNNDYAPGGYIYIVPYGSDSSVSSVIVNSDANIKGMLFNFISKNKVLSEILEGADFGNEFQGKAYYNVPSTANINGHLFTGGAAGFVEAGRGFGLIYAIKSGLLAADAILKKQDYDQLWKTSFGKELIDGFKRRAVMTRMTNKDYENMIENEGTVKAKEYKQKRAEDIQKLEVQFKAFLEKWQKDHDLNKFI